MSDVVDLVEQSKDILDDVWRQIDFEPYPETRMARLMDVIGRSFQQQIFTVVVLKKESNILSFYCFSVFFFFLCVHIPGGDLGRYVQRKLSGLKIFTEPFLSVKENLRTGITICEQWVVACEHLTGQVTDSTK